MYENGMSLLLALWLFNFFFLYDDGSATVKESKDKLGLLLLTLLTLQIVMNTSIVD